MVVIVRIVIFTSLLSAPGFAGSYSITPRCPFPEAATWSRALQKAVVKSAFRIPNFTGKEAL
jgi:hypothetical protein